MESSSSKPFDIYVRVSRVNGRSGASYRSPQDQEDIARRIGLAHGLPIGETVREEDVSGGKRAEDRELDRLIGKVERGESGGILVWKVSRFSRSLADGVLAAKRVADGGGRIIGEDLDTAGPMGKPLLGFLLGFAEEELDQRRETFGRATRGAVDRGVHFAAVTPYGYLQRAKGDASPLRINPEEAPHVLGLFERRAAGASWGELCDWLDSVGAKTRSGAAWTHTTVSQILRNRVYLGEVAMGEGLTKSGAHPAIVTPTLFDQVQATRALRKRSGEGVAASCLLPSLLVCDSCGHRMQVSRGGANGRAVSYVCRYRGCERRARASAPLLDDYVTAAFLTAARTMVESVEGVADGDGLAEAEARADAAESALRTFATTAEILDGDTFREGLAARTAERDAAREAVAVLRNQLGALQSERTDVVTAWPGLTVAERRRVLGGFVDRIAVGAGRRIGGAPAPVDDRVVIHWRGDNAPSKSGAPIT